MKRIDKEQLEAFLKLKIAMTNVFHVSRPTLFMDIRYFNIDNQRFSPLSGPEIRQAVEVIACNHPNVGEVMLMGHWVQESGTLFTIPTQLALYNTLISLFNTTETALQGRRGGKGGKGGLRGGQLMPETNKLHLQLVTNKTKHSIYLTNRFHVAVRLFSNRSQMTSKCGKNKKVAHEAIAECVTDVLTTF